MDATAPTLSQLESTEQARLYRFLAGLIAASAILSPILAGNASSAEIPLRLLWALAFGVAAHQAPRLAPRQEKALRVALMLSGVVILDAVMWLRRGSGVVSHPGLIMLTLGSVLVLRDAVAETMLVTGLSAAGHVAVVLASTGSSVQGLRWAVLELTAALFAVHGSRLHRRLRQGERGWEEERARVAAQLADSERARRESEALAVIGRLAAGVAHEINNPLGYIKANLTCLAEELDPAERSLSVAELQQICDETQSGVERIRQIVADLKSFARGEVEGVEPCSLREVVDEALRLGSVRLRTIGSVRSELPSGLPRVQGRRRHLMQVVLNLLLNAADALEEKGQGLTGEIVVRAVTAGDQVTLSVDDTGPGLSAEVQARMFDPFFTTKPPGKGTGLGLSVAREYVERYGGRLEAANRDGGGASLRIHLQAEAVRPRGLADGRDESTVHDRPRRLAVPCAA